MLVCSAYNFYPKQIRLTWLRNGQEVTSSVSFSEVMSDGDWYYQIHSYLEPIPTPGEKITCMVEHFTLSKPALQVWDPSLPVPERIKIAVGLSGLILGFVMLSSGFIYYKNKSKLLMGCFGRCC
uniref:Ig-like domain-containing protein n=1 Tax=Sander lucioperca TaxID=283035 RepID=A0A8D0A2M2_SANLU